MKKKAVRKKPSTGFSNQVYYTDWDRIIWEEELEAFVPRNVFDAHLHLWTDDHLPAGHAERDVFVQSDLAETERWNRRMFPGRKFEYLVLGFPCPGVDVKTHNAFLVREMKGRPDSRINRLVTPQCRVSDIRADVLQHGFLGLKPYRRYSVTGDINQCRIHEFLTHEQMELANEMGLWVTMHLSRYHGCADEYNLKDLEEYTTRRYPKIKWILAHCGRSFTYWAIEKAVDRLRRLPNIWYDSSAVTEVMPHYTLFKKEDHRRIFFGTDNLTANSFHGKYAAMGRFWYQIESPAVAKQPNLHTDARPILSVYEQLLCMKHAAEMAGLSRRQIEDIFYHNARKAFGVKG